MMGKYTMILKKLIFAPLFLISFALLVLNLNNLFGSYDFIFSFSIESLISLLIICVLLTFSGVFFALFISFSQELIFILPVISLAAIIPLFIIKPPLGIVIIIGTIITLLFTYFILSDGLKKYLTFSPKSIFSPSIKLMAQLLLLTISLSYFLSINQAITKDGFQIPDAILDTALKQAGLDPKILDTLDKPTKGKNITQELTKSLVKAQFEQTIKPYTNIIPIILTALLFITLMSLNSLVGFFISPLLWIIFLILEKSGFVKFQEEMRPVKKMVI